MDTYEKKIGKERTKRRKEGRKCMMRWLERKRKREGRKRRNEKGKANAIWVEGSRSRDFLLEQSTRIIILTASA